MRGVVISQTLDCMINNGRGYRTEAYSGSGVRRAEDVIRHELSMGNSDIVRFIQTNYEQLKEYQLDDEFFDEIKDLSIEEQDAARNEAFDYMCQDNAPHITEDILKIASEYLGAKDVQQLKAVWLSTMDMVIERYDGERGALDEYMLVRGDFLVISDLGEDGALFIF